MSSVAKTFSVSKKFTANTKWLVRHGVSDIARDIFHISYDRTHLREGEFWAVRDVSFSLEQGKSMGIIGRNGSGKTTLLKMVNGIVRPDKGKIEAYGKIGALIQVGAGFHPLLTGRENIYVNGSILGLSRREIDRQFDDIVEFSEIGKFLDSPVNTYSSGMYVRLGFSIAVHSRPDILLIDEVMAVGDREFQLRCYRKLHELKTQQGVSMILVSHNEYAMREYTDYCIMMDQGKLVYQGKSEDVISKYINESIKHRELATTINSKISKDISVASVNITGTSGKITSINTGSRITISIGFIARRRIRSPIFGLDFTGSNGMITGLWSSYSKMTFSDIKGKGFVRVKVDRLDLPIDKYNLSLIICEGSESNVILWENLPEVFSVNRPRNTRGTIKLAQKWDLRN